MSTPQLASQHRLTHLPAPTDLSPSIARNCLHWSDFPDTSFAIFVSSPSIPFPPNLQLAPYLPEWLMRPSPSQSFVNFTPCCNSLRCCLRLSRNEIIDIRWALANAHVSMGLILHKRDLETGATTSTCKFHDHSLPFPTQFLLLQSIQIGRTTRNLP